MASTDIINQSLYPNSAKDTIKQSVCPGPYTYEDIKNNHLLVEFSSLVNTIYNTRNKKNKDFVKIYKIAVDHTYEIDDPLIIRHFLVETVEEINDLIKNNKPYRVHLECNMLQHFLNEIDTYYEKKNFTMMMELLTILNSQIVQNI